MSKRAVKMFYCMKIVKHVYANMPESMGQTHLFKAAKNVLLNFDIVCMPPSVLILYICFALLYKSICNFTVISKDCRMCNEKSKSWVQKAEKISLTSVTDNAIIEIMQLLKLIGKLCDNVNHLLRLQ